MKFLEELERTRKELDQSQQDFATFIGISQGHYSKLVNGRQTLTLRMAARAWRRFPHLQPIFFSEIMDSGPVDCILETGPTHIGNNKEIDHVSSRTP